MNLSEHRAALKGFLDARHGATADARTPPRGSVPNVLIYKIMGKVFAILTIRGAEYLVLKCDPHLAEVLREKYAGIGHRFHMDPRHWISVDLAADVPQAEIERLANHSYDLVRAGLTRKQTAELRGERVK